MMAVKLLVNIAVMMMAPVALRCHQKRGVESSPPSSSSLTSSLDGRRVSPLFLGSHGVGGARSPSEIGSISLFLSGSAFYSGSISPFCIYMEIRNSDWTETFAVIFFWKISFLAAEEGHQPPYGWTTRVRGAPPTSCPPRTPFHVDLSPRFSKYSKNMLRPLLSRLDSV